MSARILDSDGNKTEYFDYDPIDDKCTITTVQDVSSFIDHMKEKRKQELWGGQVKNDFVHFCSIPTIVELELRKKGIDIHDKNCTKKLMQEIQQNYPYLLVHDNKRFV